MTARHHRGQSGFEGNTGAKSVPNLLLAPHDKNLPQPYPVTLDDLALFDRVCGIPGAGQKFVDRGVFVIREDVDHDRY